MIQPYRNHLPRVAAAARVAENAVLAGDVTVEAGASIWYGAVLRGDEAPIRVGEGSNIQDNAVLHCDEGFPLTVGSRVTVGHGAILHGCTVEDGCLIGMGAVLLNGCRIGAGSLIGAGALVPEGKIIPPRSLVLGVPGRVVRSVSDAETAQILADAARYADEFSAQLDRIPPI